MLASLSMLGSLDREFAHLAFDHSGVAAVASFDVGFGGYFVQEVVVVIIISGEGEKNPVSISWTG